MLAETVTSSTISKWPLVFLISSSSIYYCGCCCNAAGVGVNSLFFSSSLPSFPLLLPLLYTALWLNTNAVLLNQWKASPDAFSCASLSRDFVGSFQIIESSITGAAPSGVWDKVETVFQMVSSLAWQLTRVDSPSEHKALIYSTKCGYIDKIDW